ncbi:endonuclease/exonuclease/phosphatase family protein [Terracoccus sp. 273MFTsu3.1]|uniref:endonuclease/exonuclease/phosphatase family protein n=1 Tax=Terracoccus sp. 273MFTsu3.1 TaxID=1172188 RepID=UPI00037947AE|nr:endonuclease/exonuclease/phosphatase family protein [Terracoccus sp. 273MFTsu3.1]
MRVRYLRSPRWAVAATSVVVFFAGCLAGCDAGRAASDPTDQGRPTIGRLDRTVRVLQMNLCNSGRADCYSGGRAVSTAVALIHEHRPDMVSVNEVCRDDLPVLEQAMSAGVAPQAVASAFTSAKDRHTHAPVRCLNGQEFGNGVLAGVPPPAVGSRSYSGVYPVQDPHDSEERVWVCIALATRFTACTTHASSADTTVALNQCRFLVKSAVPRISRGNGAGPIIVGADLNLAARGSPSPEACLSDGYQRTDDGGLQSVMVSPGVGVRAHSVIDMQGTTDHPGLLVDLVLSGS